MECKKGDVFEYIGDKGEYFTKGKTYTVAKSDGTYCNFLDDDSDIHIIRADDLRSNFKLVDKNCMNCEYFNGEAKRCSSVRGHWANGNLAIPCFDHKQKGADMKDTITLEEFDDFVEKYNIKKNYCGTHRKECEIGKCAIKIALETNAVCCSDIKRARRKLTGDKGKDTIYFRDLMEKEACKKKLLWWSDNNKDIFNNVKRNDTNGWSHFVHGYDTISLCKYLREHGKEDWITWLSDNGYKTDDNSEVKAEIKDLKERIAKLEEQL